MSSSLSVDQRETLASFLAVTQAQTDTAIEVLESSGWNLEVSLALVRVVGHLMMWLG